MMSCGALVAAFMANKELLLAIWLVFEQYLASNKSIKANSTLQLLTGIVSAGLKSQEKSQTGR